MAKTEKSFPRNFTGKKGDFLLYNGYNLTINYNIDWISNKINFHITYLKTLNNSQMSYINKKKSIMLAFKAKLRI